MIPFLLFFAEDETVDVLTQIAETLAGPVGTFFLIVLIGFALSTKKIVPGWIYEDVVRDWQACRTELSDRVSKSEIELETLRRERMSRGD